MWRHHLPWSASCVRPLIQVAVVCVVGFIAGSPAAAVETRYSVTASADEIAPGESVSFSTDAPGDNYAQLFLDYVDGKPSAVARGTVAALTADLTWEAYRSSNWYDECTPGRIILRVYDVKESDTINFFIGILKYDQVMEGVPADAEVPVILSAGECPTTTSPATTSPATTSPATTSPATTSSATTIPATTSPATAISPTVLPNTGSGPSLVLVPAIIALAGGSLAVRLSRRHGAR
jgi:hypothetical protein